MTRSPATCIGWPSPANAASPGHPRHRPGGRCSPSNSTSTTTEDTSLWPQLRARPLRPDEVAVLDQMEMEHAQIDPVLERVDRALAEHDAERLVESFRTLAAGLTAHMRHEENEALPLIETHLGPPGWDAFGREIR